MALVFGLLTRGSVMANRRWIRLVPAALLGAGMAAAISVGVAGASAEGARKAPLYGPNIVASGFSCTTGAAPTAATFGTVVVNTPGPDGVLTGEVSIKGGSPNTTYSVADEQDPGGCVSIIQIASLTTNGQGNANVHFRVARVPSATRFWIGLEAGGFSQVYGSSAVSLD
jgi:hypothetical protein